MTTPHHSPSGDENLPRWHDRRAVVFRKHVQAAPSETVLHASFGGGGRAAADVAEAAASKHFKLVAIADVDLSRAAEMKKRFPEAKVYQDWRELLDTEKGLNSVTISTPDHMHATMTMRAMQMGLAVCTQKPLTHTIQEARVLAKVAREKKLVTQMGIQIHSNATHRAIVEIVHGGAIGKVKEVYSWSGKDWGDRGALPDRKDPVPEGLSWDGWLGVAADRPFIGGGYYHPGNWRKRVDFGTGTFGDMGCHILDPVFGALALTTREVRHVRRRSAKRHQLEPRRRGPLHLPRHQIHNRRGRLYLVQRQEPAAEGDRCQNRRS